MSENSSCATPTPTSLQEPFDPGLELAQELAAAGQPRFNWRYWARRLLVCNPFFLCSAALLLFGINRLSVDPHFLANETQNLFFNFFALHAYELLVVGTALVLVLRKAWYDSALLVVLENGLMLVPFMLISHASLLGKNMAVGLALSGGALALARMAAIRSFYRGFNLPGRALLLGVIILFANVGLPALFRPWIERDVEDWRIPNLVAWYVVLPLLAAGANLLPRPARYGGLPPERHWLPLFIYGLWIAGSAVHAWCLTQICSLPFTAAMLASLAVAIGWTAWHRLEDFVPCPAPFMRKVVLLTLFLTPGLAWSEPYLFLFLCSLNLVGFLVLWARHIQDVRFWARELALATCALLVAGLPLNWLGLLAFERPLLAMLSVCAYIALLALRSRNPALTILVAIAVGVGTGAIFGGSSPHPALQLALVCALAHSLRWEVSRGRKLQLALAATWLASSFAWTRDTGWLECTWVGSEGLVLLLLWSAACWFKRAWQPLWLPAIACLGLFSGPANWFVENSSAGMAALVGSLILFGAGTFVAWTRRCDADVPIKTPH